MATFLTVWAGQFVSLVGTRLTYFGIGMWLYVDTRSTSQLALVLLAGVVPGAILNPFVGALVDRWDRRVAMMVSDAGAAIGTVVIAVLLVADSLELWHLVVAVGFSSVFAAFQFPAYSAAVTLLVPSRHYGRAAGLVSLARSTATVVAPVLAGLLLVTVDIEGLLAVDIATFVVALATLVFVRFPAPERSEESQQADGSIWEETRFGFRYLAERRGLLSLVLFMSVAVLFIHFTNILLFPLVLAFAGETGFGTVASIGALGLVAGSLVMSSWGGPSRRILGVFGGLTVMATGMVVAGLRPSLVVTAIGLFLMLLSVPIVNGNNQVIFQKKVAPDVQGRVFAIRRMFTEAGAPIAYLLAAPLADRVFEPLVAAGGALAGTAGEIIGTGQGRGVGLFYVVLGLALGAMIVFGLSFPPLRNVERDLPDVMPDADTPPDQDGRRGGGGARTDLAAS